MGTSSQKVSWRPLRHRLSPPSCSSSAVRGTILVGGRPLNQFKLVQFYTDVTRAHWRKRHVKHGSRKPLQAGDKGRRSNGNVTQHNNDGARPLNRCFCLRLRQLFRGAAADALDRDLLADVRWQIDDTRV